MVCQDRLVARMERSPTNKTFPFFAGEEISNSEGCALIVAHQALLLVVLYLDIDISSLSIQR
jgi:hypothetical protein